MTSFHIDSQHLFSFFPQQNPSNPFESVPRLPGRKHKKGCIAFSCSHIFVYPQTQLFSHFIGFSQNIRLNFVCVFLSVPQLPEKKTLRCSLHAKGLGYSRQPLCALTFPLSETYFCPKIETVYSNSSQETVNPLICPPSRKRFTLSESCKCETWIFPSTSSPFPHR